MRTAALLLTAAVSLVGATNSVTVYEVDAVTQTDRVTTWGRGFAQGEIAACAQPMIGGVALDTSHYQVDVRNRWPDGSLKFAVISILHSLAANGSNTFSFQNTSSCNNGGFLSQADMLAFNGGNWGATIEVTTAGVTKVVSAKAMLAALSVADCQIEYTLRGPLVTEARVQDCTTATAYDFGAHWDGTTMNLNSGAWYTGNSQYASLHPIWTLRFVPSASAVQVQYTLENQWGFYRAQNQKYSLVLKAGSPLATVYTSAGKSYADGGGQFIHYWQEPWSKTFWSGTAPAHVRIDHNFAYLISTKILPSYELTKSVNPGSDYTAFAASDRGDINGISVIDSDWATGTQNYEGSLLQRPDLAYLYNMGSCGTANSACAKAWDILSGETDANPATTLAGVPGGGGVWAAHSHFPFHLRDSSPGTKFFDCPGRAGKDALDNTACSGTVPAFGRVKAVTTQTGGGWTPPIGDVTSQGFIIPPSHWQDYTYLHYLLTGDDFTYREVIYSGAGLVGGDDLAFWKSGPWGYNPPETGNDTLALLRGWAWPTLQQARAASLALDGSPEQTYLAWIAKNNFALMEGYMNITGTELTPSSTNASCSGFNAASANRWDYGHCLFAGGLTNARHSPVAGIAQGEGNGALDTTCYDLPPYHLSWGVMASYTLSEELGDPSWTATVRHQLATFIIDMTQDPGFNPYLIASFTIPWRGFSAGCPNTDATPFLTLTQSKANIVDSALRNVSSFQASIPGSPLGFPCTEHSYDGSARAAASFITGESSGSYSGLTAFNWLDGHVPYFANGCSSYGDTQIKLALSPRLVAPTGTSGFVGASVRGASVR